MASRRVESGRVGHTEAPGSTSNFVFPSLHGPFDYAFTLQLFLVARVYTGPSLVIGIGYKYFSTMSIAGEGVLGLIPSRRGTLGRKVEPLVNRRPVGLATSRRPLRTYPPFFLIHRITTACFHSFFRFYFFSTQIFFDLRYREHNRPNEPIEIRLCSASTNHSRDSGWFLERSYRVRRSVNP